MIPLNLQILRKGESRKLLEPDQISELNKTSGMAINLPITQAFIIEDGTKAGRATVTFAIELPDGKLLMAETTARLLKPIADIASTLNGDI